MRGQSHWNYAPYTRLNQHHKRSAPYICRVAPEEGAIQIEWFDAGSQGLHDLYYRRLSTDLPYRRVEGIPPVVRMEALEPMRDYEFYVARRDLSERSDLRIAQAVGAVGTVVNYLHPYDEAYAFSGRSLCSPSIVKLPSGALIASMDVFAGGAPQNLSLLYRSRDGGENWQYLTELFPCFWGKLFVHGEGLYMLANTTEYGNLVIGCSQDEGESWSAPVTILPGAGSAKDQGPHKAPMPVIEWKGRLYTGIDYGSWSSGGHANALLSIDSGADLLCAHNWSCTDFCAYDPGWPGAAQGNSGGGLEGNAVPGPDGGIYNVLRYQMTGCDPAYGKALILKGNVDDPEGKLEFHKIVDFNGGSNSKFDLLYDQKIDAYWAIVSEVVHATQPAQRNVLSLAVSAGGFDDFHIVKNLYDFREEDAALVGLQYISFAFDGEDIIYLSRTAMHKARNYHDANYITFHRIKNFRQYLHK